MKYDIACAILALGLVLHAIEPAQKLLKRVRR